MRKHAKKLLSLILVFTMLLGMLPSTAFAASSDSYMKIYHLDCGRKYFSTDQIKDLLDTLSANDFNYMELAFGNNGLRFLLDDMSVEVNGSSYSSAEVTAAIQEGNKNYTTGSTGELSESEMDDIIDYAAEKGIEIIPLLNSPGHMHALMDAMESLSGATYSYSGSASTIDVTNADAVAFAQAIISKYVDYFDAKGCSYFNFGADEYANDSSASGFSSLISTKRYDDFADYVNGVAAIIKDAGMIPMTFNDGIYYDETTSNDGKTISFDEDIVICYWTCGWTGYAPASASFLSDKGHEIINTNDGWYYVLGRTSSTYGLYSAQNGVQNKAYDAVSGDDYDTVTPIGSMMCLWCDEPEAPYDSTEVSNVQDLISTFAKNNPDVFDLSSGDIGGGDIEGGGEEGGTVIEGLPEKYAGTVTGSSSEGGTAYVLDTDGVNAGSRYVIAAPSTGKALSYQSSGLFSYSPSTYNVEITTANGLTRAEADDHTLWTIDSNGRISSDDVYVYNGRNGIISSWNSTNWSISHAGDGSYYISNNGYYLTYNSGFGRSSSRSTVRLFKETTLSGSSQYLVDLDGINTLIADTEDLYENGADYGYSADLWNAFTDAFDEAESAVSDTAANYTDQSAAQTQQTAVNTAAKALYDAWQALKDESVVLTVNHICGDNTFDTTEYFYADGATVTVTAKSFEGYTLLGSDTRTVTMDGDQTIDFYYEVNASEVDPIYAQYLCTSLKILGSDNAYGKTITADELTTPRYISNLAPATGTSGGMTYYLWKARVIDRAETDGGQLDDGSEDNECIVTDGAWDIDALMYQDGDYWFRKTGSTTWSRLDYTEDGSDTGHQLVFYYQCRYANDDDLGAVYSSDWGYNSAQDSSVYEIKMSLYLIEGEETSLISSESTWLANGIKVLSAVLEPQYEIVRTELKYFEGEQNVPSSGTPTETATFYGQITDSPSLPAENDGAYEVAYYIREKANLSVTYEWLNYPAAAVLPVDDAEYKSGDTVTVDTAYTAGSTIVDGAYLYTFSGWHTDSALKNAAGATFAISGDTVLYGNWTRELNEAITITADSASKIYDGTALTDNGFTVTYIGRVVSPNADGTYTISGEPVSITAVVSGTCTNVGETDNLITEYAVTSDSSTEFNVITVNGTLKITPRIIVDYYKEGSTAKLGSETLTDAYEVGDTVTLTAAQLDAEKPDTGYLSGLQQGTVPYPVTDSNEQVIEVLYPAEPIDISVTKIWDDENNVDNKRPSSVTVQLTANGSVVKEATLRESGGWKYRWNDLPVYENGSKINYAVTETVVPDNYSVVITGSAENGFTVTNSYPAKYTVTYAYTDPVPANAPAVPEPAAYSPQTEVSVQAAPTMDGYSFSGWTTTDVSVADGKFTVTDDVTFTGSWSINRYDYTVKYYKDGIAEGNLLETETGTADFGSAIPYTNGAYAPEGYDKNGAVSGQTTVTTVSENNVLNIVYTALPVYTVTYSWSGKIPTDAQLPDPITGLVKNQSYKVNNTFTNETVVEVKDTFGNVIGKYTFSGWTDPNNGVMDDSDIIITGKWTYTEVAVPTHKVSYSWENAPAGQM
ncbi:MAG: Cna B-type domain-containing protein, partial [Butyricicoccus sp.]|nr:Cna B-type domain-containing protein [Butyricicoccus sp.]